MDLPEYSDLEPAITGTWGDVGVVHLKSLPIDVDNGAE
jgi:hypothetical protein